MNNAIKEKLDVYLYETKIGELLDEDNNIRFRYTTLDTDPISLKMPVTLEPYSFDATRAYFANLLPEGETRSAIENGQGIRRGNDFALLKAIGGDCAGAVTIFPQDQTPFINTNNYKYTPISEDDIIDIIKNLPVNPLMTGKVKARLSLAGAQNKTTLYIDNAGNYFVPENGAPSTHILKVPINVKDMKGNDVYYDTVQNETYSMMLAKAMGLNVPNVELKYIGDIPVFIIERYDRITVNNCNIKRLLQEDFCQLLGFAPETKYQYQGGPNLEECFGILKQYSDNIIEDRAQMLKWVAFNIVLGNADAHAKNISLLQKANKIRLAPFYDVLSTSIYDQNSDFAMSIGRNFISENITTSDFKELSQYTDINLKLIDEVNRKISDSIINTSKSILIDYEHKYGKCNTVCKIVESIEARASILQGCLLQSPPKPIVSMGRKR